MTKTTFEKVNDIFQCKLLLENNTEFIIPVREDGYIFATQLCKVAGKQLSKWKNSPETKKLIERLKVICSLGISQLIEVYKGKTSKYEQGTWIHPDLGLSLAQWCSTDFLLQVSKWMKELIFTGKVEIGKEKTNDEIIKNLNEKLKEAEDIIISYDSENKNITKKYNKLYQIHQAFIRRKELYKLKEGSCVYLINMSRDNEPPRIKVGNSGNITDRTSTYRTSNPFCKLLCVLYTQQNITTETCMKIRYEKQLKPNNSEFISDVPVEVLINDLKEISETLRCSYRFEIQEELDKFNRHIIPIDEIEEEIKLETIEIESSKFKRCGGVHHKTEESRLLPFESFFKNASNKDGISRICKECYLTGQYGDKRKRRKIVVIPKHDTLMDKWCNRCESVKSRDLFYKDTSTKDGVGSNCKKCKLEQKQSYTKRIKEKDNETNV
jgi:hypothetical protein